MQPKLKTSKFLYPLIAAFAICLASCGSVPSQDSEVSSAEQADLPASSASDYEEILASLPERPMTEETLSLLLEAEFSGYRGDPARLVELYLRAARDTGDTDLLERTVQLALDIGDLDRAMQASVLWYENQPDSIEARALAVQMLARNGEPEAAWYIAKESNSPQLVRLVASETSTSGNISQILWLGQELEAFGADKQPHSELYTAEAILLNQIEREEQAAELSRQALILDPTNIHSLLVRTEALIKLEQHLEAATTVENWILVNWNRSQDRPAILALFAEMEPEAADPSLSRLYNLHPDSSDVLLAVAEVKTNTGQLAAAEMLYLQIAELEGYADLAHVQLGRISHLEENFDEAVEWYRLLPIGRYYQYAQDQIVSILAGTDRIDDLLDYFEDQRRQNPENLEILYASQSQYLSRIVDDSILMELLDEGLSRYPNNIDLRYSRSLVADRMGRLDIAEADLRAVIDIDENNANALNALGYSLTINTDRFAEAYDLIERALTIQPDSPAIQDSMGWVLYKLGEYQEALYYLQMAQDNLFDPEVIAHHAEVLWKLDRVDEALDLLTTSMLQFPGNDLLIDIRVRILDDLTQS